LKALQQRHPGLDWTAIDEVIYGCANQAGEETPNVARMSALLAGLPTEVPRALATQASGRMMRRLQPR
jgi:acetyl-CoA acyltransferase